MALTTLPVRLVLRIPEKSPVMRILLITIIVFIGSALNGCSSSESGGDIAEYALQQQGGGLECDDFARLALHDGQCSRSGSSSLTGAASASLAWDPVGGVVGYIIHYGTQSPGSSGSCAYAQSLFTSTPSATVTGLAGNTTYYFAVSAYNGLESACSAEVMTVTRSA